MQLLDLLSSKLRLSGQSKHLLELLLLNGLLLVNLIAQYNNGNLWQLLRL